MLFLLLMFGLMISIPIACKISNKRADERWEEYKRKQEADRKKAGVKVYFKNGKAFAEVNDELYIHRPGESSYAFWDRVCDGERMHFTWEHYWGLGELALKILADKDRLKRAEEYQKIVQDTGIYR